MKNQIRMLKRNQFPLSVAVAKLFMLMAFSVHESDTPKVLI